MSKNKKIAKNILSLVDYKQGKLNRFQNESMKKYLEVLSMDELISESQDLIKTINNGIVDRDIINMSKQLLGEFTNRLNAENDGFTSVLKQWGKKVASLPNKTKK